MNEGLPLPDLIIVDGGKGHMSGVLDVLENELDWIHSVAGLRKMINTKRRITLWTKCRRCTIEKNSQAFYLLHRIQDEVHRFAITFHRQTRQKQDYNLYWTLLMALK